MIKSQKVRFMRSGENWDWSAQRRVVGEMPSSWSLGMWRRDALNKKWTESALSEIETGDKEGCFDRAVKQQSRWLAELVESPPLDVFESRIDFYLSGMIYTWLCRKAGGCSRWCVLLRSPLPAPWFYNDCDERNPSDLPCGILWVMCLPASG